MVEETHARGQIDEKEFTMLKKRIDALVMKLNEFSPEWKQPPLKQFLKTLPFFSFFSDDELNALLLCSKEIDVHKDDWMMKVIKTSWLMRSHHLYKFDRKARKLQNSL